ncbi:MAG: hypothetical protein GEV12_06620 [Micromonosporaceae bacterium]|nr:hypothetical protein [Micromonosporaceae bacterium]
MVASPSDGPAEDSDGPAEEQPAEDWRAVKVGVRTEQPSEIGDWLTRTSAFDAAGADSLWVDPDPGLGLDVLALAAALAVVTFRARLVVALPDSAAAAQLARTLDTIRRLSRGRLALIAEADADAGQHEELAGLIPGGVGVFRRVPDPPGSFEGPPTGAGDADAERWESVPAPPGRAGLRTARTDAAARGVRGLVVPADPRLLDMLRNPDDPGVRRDLYLAQG